MSFLKDLFEKKESKSSCCNIQIVEVKNEESNVEKMESQLDHSS